MDVYFCCAAVDAHDQPSSPLPPAETAQSALGSDVTDAVITVPFEFTQAQKTALRCVT